MGWFFTILFPQRKEVDEILSLVRRIAQQQGDIMATLDEVLTKVTEEDAVDDSIIALLVGIKAQLDAVLAGNLSPAQQAKVDEIFAKVEASKVKVENAILANTPQAPA